MKSNSYNYFGPALRINVNSKIIKNATRLGKIYNVDELYKKIPDLKKFSNYIELHESFNNTLILNTNSISDYGLYIIEDNFNFKIVSGNDKIKDRYDTFKKNISSIKDNGFYMKGDGSNFIMKNEYDAFKKEIYLNGLKKILDDSLTSKGYQVFYTLLRFGDR